MNARSGMAVVALTVLLVGCPLMANARPEFLDAFNAKYGTAGGLLDTCQVCHKGSPPRLNPYGAAVRGKLGRGINRALAAIEKRDSDKDHFSNIREINAGTFPGDKKSHP